MQLLKVTNDSDPAVLARAIVNILRADDTPVLSTVTAEAKVRALDAVALADLALARAGFELSARVARQELDLEGRRRTAVRLTLRAQPLATEDAAAPARDRAPDLG
jgi:stage V sporulation protein S